MAIDFVCGQRKRTFQFVSSLDWPTTGGSGRLSSLSLHKELEYKIVLVDLVVYVKFITSTFVVYVAFTSNTSGIHA